MIPVISNCLSGICWIVGEKSILYSLLYQCLHWVVRLLCAGWVIALQQRQRCHILLIMCFYLQAIMWMLETHKQYVFRQANVFSTFNAVTALTSYLAIVKVLKTTTKKELYYWKKLSKNINQSKKILLMSTHHNCMSLDCGNKLELGVRGWFICLNEILSHLIEAVTLWPLLVHVCIHEECNLSQITTLSIN